MDPRNLARFDELSTTASEWMNEKTGAFRALHSFNKLRVPWIAGQLTKVCLQFTRMIVNHRITDIFVNKFFLICTL